MSEAKKSGASGKGRRNAGSKIRSKVRSNRQHEAAKETGGEFGERQPKGPKRLDHLKRRFEQFGLRPNKQLGQNFLLDRNQVVAICRDAQLFTFDTVLEVGPGSGLLTCTIGETGANLLCCELDRGMAALVRDEVKDFPNVEIFEGDILKSKNALNPTVLSMLEERLAARDEKVGELKCVSNLPYCVAGPFIANLCADALPWERGVFMIQFEMAERLAAKAGTSQYGNLSIVAQLACRSVRILRSVPPQVFWPRPQVKSAVIQLDFRPAAERLALPWAELRRVTTAIFASRRKTLGNSFRGLFGKGKAAREMTTLLMDRLSLDEHSRGEKLTPERILEIAQHLQAIEREVGE